MSRQKTTLAENKVKREAIRISKELGGADIIVIAAGSREKEIDRCVSGFSNKSGRLRDFLGILEAVKQIESLMHFRKR